MNIFFSARGDNSISTHLDFVQEKKRKTGQQMTCQTLDMQVCHVLKGKN